MQAAIGYLRVGKKEQVRSGLGLAARRHEIEAFGAREGFAVKTWHQDVQTGAGADALLLRPGLATALTAAKRSPAHTKVGWWLDNRTAERIRITAICKRHPEYTAKQVLETLGPEHSLRVRWVNKIMNDCWQALGRNGPRQCNGWTPERRKRQAVLIQQFRP